MVANLRAKAKDLIIVISSPIPLPTVNGSFRDGSTCATSEDHETDFIQQNSTSNTSQDRASMTVSSHVQRCVNELNERSGPGLAREVAAELGVYFVDHANAVADAYERLGKGECLGRGPNSANSPVSQTM